MTRKIVAVFLNEQLPFYAYQRCKGGREKGSSIWQPLDLGQLQVKGDILEGWKFM